MAWWLVFDDDNGRPCLKGPYMVYGKALEKKDALDREGHLYDLDTTNIEKATMILKGRKIDEEGVGKGRGNFRHKDLAKYADS